MEKNKVPVLSIIFYVLAVILMAYAIWAAVYSIDYVSQAITQNQLMVEGFEFEIASFYMTNVAQYVVFAAILFGIGWILQKFEEEILLDFDIEDDEALSEDEWLDEEESEADVVADQEQEKPEE